MYLYLGTNPRALYLVTNSNERHTQRPQRALVFRAGLRPNQATVEFLHKHEVNTNNLLKLSSRQVKGVLGLISVDHGMYI